MRDWIVEADKKIQLERQSHTPPATTPLTNKERVFLHFEYHANDIPKSKVRALFNTTCKDIFETTLGIKQLTIAYSRSNNIQESVTKAKLHQAPGRESNKYYYLGESPTT